MLESTVRRMPEKVFIDDGDRRITYREFDALASQLAHVLADHEVEKGTPVCVFLPNCVELAIGYHACAKLGAIFVPITSMATPREVTAVAQRTEAPVIITGEAGAEIATTALANVASLRHALVNGPSVSGCRSLDELLTGRSVHYPAVWVGPSDITAVFFTSGTTGEPKGAMQTHGSVYSTVRDMSVFNRFQYGRETLLDVLPMFNNFGTTCVMLAAVYTAGTVILHERWDTERVLGDIARHQVTYFAGTPTMLVYLWKAFRAEQHDLSSLKVAIAGGAPLAPEVVEACEGILGIASVCEIYGATEVCGYVTASPVVGVRKRGSAGPAFGSARITIVDDDDRELPPGEVGEVIISGDTVGAGYWRDPETTAAAYTDAGWRSGDLGYLDEDGYIYIVDRKKDLIISGGYNIYPVEVEDILYRHPKVQMCSIVGVPDEVKGEIAVAFVVPSEEPSDELAAELITHCRAELSAYKAPRHIEFVDEMPLGPTGKILKRELRKRRVELSVPQMPR
jgi:long-chain acyl-CoA synthetase